MYLADYCFLLLEQWFLVILAVLYCYTISLLILPLRAATFVMKMHL